jgi:NADPH2:quinone reductase
MNAAVVRTFGEAPSFEPFPDPTVGEGEVLVDVRAAGLHPIVRVLASGEHYGSFQPPLVAGVDGVGRLEDGTRVYFGMARPPYGTMAERTVASRAMLLPLAEGVDDLAVAAAVNPGIASLGGLRLRAGLAPGENVLVLGATGVAGQLAVQVAKRLGAGRVVAVGRSERVLAALPGLGADATIGLDQPDDAVVEAIARESRDPGIDVVLDFLWGRPAELLVRGITRRGLLHVAPRVRLVSVGESAGPTIALPSDVLRGSGLEVLGSGGGTVPLARLAELMPAFLADLAAGHYRIAYEPVPLAEVGEAWARAAGGRRLVLVP